MKKFVLLFISLLFISLNAQFNIHGKFEHYAKSPVLIKIYRDGVPTLIQRVVTDDSGNFNYEFSQPYNGLMILELSSSSYRLLSDNNNITFFTDINDSTQKINFAPGINADYSQYLSVVEKKEIRDNNLKPIQNFYNPEDQFYKDLTKEISRIDALSNPSFNNENLNYFISSKEYLSKVGSDEKSSTSWMRELLTHLINDGSELENYGFLNDYVVSYISLATYGAKSKNDAGEKMYNAVDSLINELGEDTSRGQSVLAISISLLKSNGFTDVANRLDQKAQNLTCEINDALTNVIKAPLSVGEIAPNIEFTKEIKGYKSLYDVDAKKKLLVFWGSWCPHCRREMPFIKEFYNGFKKSGGEIVTFALDLKESDYIPLIKDAGFITDSDLLKWDSPIAKKYGVNATPTIFLLDQNNKILKVGSRVSEFVEF